MWGDSDDEELLLASAEDAENTVMVERVEVKDKVILVSSVLMFCVLILFLRLMWRVTQSWASLPRTQKTRIV